jgi:hypothetical protein
MTMKKYIPVLIVALFVLFSLPKVDQGFVDLPGSQEVAITGIFVAAAALVFDWLIGRFPWLEFFKQYRETWAAALSLLFIHALENWLPTGSDMISIEAVSLLIAVALYLLGRTALVRRGTQGFV